jgi:hypothetical protein
MILDTKSNSKLTRNHLKLFKMEPISTHVETLKMKEKTNINN